MNWATIFDVAHPRPGATDAAIQQFVSEIAKPISRAEVQDVKLSQRNPFPATDPLHSAWKPFDAAAWVIPDRPLPPAYLSFLQWSNGGEFGNGDPWCTLCDLCAFVVNP